MKEISMAALVGFLLQTISCWGQSNVLNQVNHLELQGQFKAAAAALTGALQNHGLPKGEQKRLEFELDRLARIKQDFPYTKEQLFAELKKAVKGLTAEEYEQWISEGRFDNREIDGTLYFMTSSVGNLFFRYPELNPRRTPPKNTVPLEHLRLETCAAIKNAALKEQKPYVLPKRFQVTMTVTAKPGAAPPGETISAWLPIPRHYPFQTDFEWLSASSQFKHMNDDDSPIRAVLLEQPAKKNKETVFKIDYNYTTYGVYFDVKPEQVQPCPDDPALKAFTREVPHIVIHSVS